MSFQEVIKVRLQSQIKASEGCSGDWNLLSSSIHSPPACGWVQQTCAVKYVALAGAEPLHLTCCFYQKKYLHVKLREETIRFSWFHTEQARHVWLKSGSRPVDFRTQERPHLRGRCTRGAPLRHPRHCSAPLCRGNTLCASVRSVCVGSPCLRRRCRNGVCAVSVCGRPGRRCRRAAPLGERWTKSRCVTDSCSCFS